MRINPFAVIPTKVGIHLSIFAKAGPWIPTFVGMTIATLASAAHAAPSAGELEQAGNLFAITCSSSFCHGEGGAGGRGPSLRNRSNFTPDFVRTTVTNGRSGTPMPSFKDSLSKPELEMIVNYVMSLSPDNHSTSAAPSAPPAQATPTPARLSPQAMAGEALFFGATKPAGCALCHSYGEKGGPIGPDLSGIAKEAPKDIYQALVSPNAKNPNYSMVKIADRGGQPVTGLLKQRSDKIIQLYDLSSVPPVLRSFYPADGAKEAYPGDIPPYKHDLSGYSKDELTALIAFLKSAAGPSKDVTTQDLAQ